MNLICTVPVAELVTDVCYKETATHAEMAYFTFCHNNNKFFAACFDDGDEKGAYRRIRDSLNLKKGSFVTLNCDLSFHHAPLIEDDRWKELSKEVNPTWCLTPRFRIISIDYAIPIEIHKKIKEKETNDKPKKISPIGDLSGFREDGDTV